jgi:hypothetical protein
VPEQATPSARETIGEKSMDLFIRGAMRALALIDSIRDKRASKIGFRLPTARRPRAGSSLPNRWDRQRREYLVDSKFLA